MALNHFFLPSKVLSLSCHEFSNVHKDFFLKKKLWLTCRKLHTKLNLYNLTNFGRKSVAQTHFLHSKTQLFGTRKQKFFEFFQKLRKYWMNECNVPQLNKNAQRRWKYECFLQLREDPLFTFLTFSSKTVKVV